MGTKANPRYVDAWAEEEPLFHVDEIRPRTAH
jgi:hypothetical protein